MKATTFLQIKGRRCSEALGPGAETMQSLSTGNRTDHRLRPVCVQRKGNTDFFLYNYLNVFLCFLVTFSCFCNRVKSWWAPGTLRSLKWGRRMQRATFWWTDTWTAPSGVWAPILHETFSFLPLRTAPFVCGTSRKRSGWLSLTVWPCIPINCFFKYC